MASQNTVHPSDDRVFSIRELMLMMTVPRSFKWVETDFSDLNALSFEKKRAFLKKEEIKIRQSLGEAVPTVIFQSIARKIKEALKHTPLKTALINKLVSSNELSTELMIRYTQERNLITVALEKENFSKYRPKQHMVFSRI